MGTNYYVWLDSPEGKPEKLHIGKSSMGWVFSLRVYPDRGINTLYDWLPILADIKNCIVDEYSAKIPLSEMISTIVNRSREFPVNWTKEFYDLNHATPGPNNLVRGLARDGYTHGEGTWDYCIYEFC
jgi:hypothetical protein